MHQLLLAAIQRRPRRATWPYGVIAVLYVFLALFFLGDTGRDIPRELPQVWFLFVPALVIVAQIAYPTVLGWVLILAGVGSYALAGLYYSIINNLVERPLQWSRDPEAVGLGTIFVIVLLAISALMIRNRPRGSDVIQRKQRQEDVRM